MPRFLSAVAALPVALVFALLAASPVAAIGSVKTTGAVGHWSFNESFGAPLVLCSYGATTDGNHYSMTKIKVQPPTVLAADRNSAKVDTRTVSWQFQIQRKNIAHGKWKVVASSKVQKATAKDNAAAPFTALTLKHSGKPAANDTSWIVRVKVLIKWYTPGGSVEGSVSFNPSYYTVTTPDFSFTSSQTFCQEVVTNG